MEGKVQPHSRGDLPRREVMQTPDEVAAMLRLKSLGWGIKRIAHELGCSHMTVRHYVAQGDWVPYRGAVRPRALAGLEDWLAERFELYDDMTYPDDSTLPALVAKLMRRVR